MSLRKIILGSAAFVLAASLTGCIGPDRSKYDYPCIIDGSKIEFSHTHIEQINNSSRSNYLVEIIGDEKKLEYYDTNNDFKVDVLKITLTSSVRQNDILFDDISGATTTKVNTYNRNEKEERPIIDKAQQRWDYITCKILEKKVEEGLNAIPFTASVPSAKGN